ncbi:hypothetical protein C8R45DRAFT_1034138 [Mycena sanguinolenta]|nr:hypothetical protein C8R45DRAFT_1034138 [Mycena sanguinolenta]
MSLLSGFLLFSALVLAIPFSDVMQKISDCFSGNKDKCVLFLPLSKDAFVIRMQWLWNSILRTLQWGYAIVRYMLVILVNWYRNTFPRVTAWLWNAIPKDAFVIRIKWLGNTILRVLQWGYANVVRYMLVILVNWYQNTFPRVTAWLWNAILRVLQWGYANVVRHMLVILVNWYRNTFPRVTAWLLRTDAQTIVNLVREHRQAILTIALICSIPTLLLLPVFFLAVLGFGVAGIRRGSPAAGYQSKVYRGFTPAGSRFARMESAGMKTTTNPVMALVLVVFSMFAGLLAIFAWTLESIPDVLADTVAKHEIPNYPRH